MARTRFLKMQIANKNFERKKMKNIIKKIAAVAMAFTLLGTGSAVTSTISPETANSITASAAQHHYYVLKCDYCYQCFSNGAIGKAAMKVHLRKNHGGGWYTKSDVCTAMGCHTKACDKASNNKRYYVCK